MATDNTKKIEALKDARDSGVLEISVGGTRTKFASIADMNSLIRQLEAEQGTTKRPAVWKSNLGGAW